MSDINKENDLKEKLRQALASTERVIPDDFNNEEKNKENTSSKKFDFFNLEKLNTKSDFVKARAFSDS